MLFFFLFFFNATATTEIYTLSLHDALPIWFRNVDFPQPVWPTMATISPWATTKSRRSIDRKSTRLNSSHRCISYAVFCLKKKKNKKKKNTAQNKKEIKTKNRDKRH